jgi:hypothetical protein
MTFYSGTCQSIEEKIGKKNGRQTVCRIATLPNPFFNQIHFLHMALLARGLSKGSYGLAG